ncbi:hydantoinase/oxoprolinase family protein [Tundrisphaera sp. TA3]|uniref:hydantoinase/oxoprolinase family protein n=1 Tax=Tundrisphaera sp. TA3 TaxID=3435775 RepID=UPI003EC06008
MNPAPRTWVALDIGGANLKAAHASGETRTVAFELWKRPERLAEELRKLLGGLPPADGVALTMTAELCDCFPTKAVGVRAVVDATREACPGDVLAIWCVDGRFHPASYIREHPAGAAAANWLALATVVARMVPDGRGLLIDIGSTTVDLIPFAGGAVTARGRTDTERLRSGELVYAGARRTPLCALATDVVFGEGSIGLAAELFSTTLDVYLTLGEVAEDPDELSTADGRPATVDHARDRLARMIGADRDGFSPEDARDLARAFDAALRGRLLAAAARALGEADWPPRVVAIAGSGAFLARRVAEEWLAPGGTILDLEQIWGPHASSAGCAHALLALARDRDEAGDFRGDAWS